MSDMETITGYVGLPDDDGLYPVAFHPDGIAECWLTADELRRYGVTPPTVEDPS